MVNLSKIVAAMALAGAVVACGNDTQKDTKKETINLETTEEVAAPAAVSEFLIVKVPVDALGNELNDNFETKAFASDSFDSATNTESAFAAASKVVVANELDQDSSSEQWHSSAYYWNTPWYPGKALGRGLWWGRNPYSYYGGYNYSYNHYRNYNSNGCNYYVYRSSGYGYRSNGYGYGY
jgi:hypothetical protein